MGKLDRLYKRPETRMKVVIVSLVILVLAVTFFMIKENQAHREKYLNVYHTAQMEYTEQVANQLEMLIKQGEEDDSLVSWMEKKCGVSASSWSFLCRDEVVLFAKDAKTTGNLREEKKKSAFIQNIERQAAVLTLTERQIGGKGYVIGTITDENYALSQGEVQQHEIYLYLMLGIFVMLTVMTVIGLTAKLNQVERSLENTSKTLQQQNIKLEWAGEEAVLPEIQKEEEPERESQSFYDSDIIGMFLSKSDDEALMPMQILFIDLVMESRYYSRKEIFDVMEKVKKFLGRTHVTGEIQKGRFVVLMYRTTPEEAQDILDKCHSFMEQKQRENGIRLKMHIAEVRDGKKAMAVYEEGWKQSDE